MQTGNALQFKILEIASRIQELRTILGYDEEYMAKKIGISLDEYLSYEAGEQDLDFAFLYMCAQALGVDVTEAQNGLIIRGGKALMGATVPSFNDHRIAMSAAVAALACTSSVTITEAEAVAKSYPTFFEDLAALGASVSKE